jgi:hypothetical protein
MIPRYCKFPLGDGSNLSLGKLLKNSCFGFYKISRIKHANYFKFKDHFIVKYGHLFDTNSLLKEQNASPTEVVTDYSNMLLNTNFEQLKSLQKIIKSKYF